MTTNRRLYKARGKRARFQDTITGRIDPWETMMDGVTEAHGTYMPPPADPSEEAHARLMKLTKAELVARWEARPELGAIRNVSKATKAQLANGLVSVGCAR